MPLAHDMKVFGKYFKQQYCSNFKDKYIHVGFMNLKHIHFSFMDISIRNLSLFKISYTTVYEVTVLLY